MFIFIYLFIVYLFNYHLFIYFIYLFDWLTPLSAIISLWGGPHTNHHFYLCKYFVHFSFLGKMCIYVYSFLWILNYSPPLHSVNMGIKLEVHGALVLFWGT